MWKRIFVGQANSLEVDSLTDFDFKGPFLKPLNNHISF